VFGPQSCPGRIGRIAGVLTMPHDTEFPADSKTVVLSDDREQAIDELARLAGAALRSPAPEQGASAIMRRARTQRIVRAGVAVVSVLAVVAIGLAVVNRRSESQRPGEDTPDNTEVITDLHDVDQQEAAPLALRALITENELGVQWSDDKNWSETEFQQQAALTIAAMPECAVLTSVGVFPPTTKSAGAFQSSVLGIHNVMVFATPEDASRAMDVLAGAVFPKCWFDFWDRETPIDFKGTTSTTEAWDAPKITAHGDRQITVGQYTTRVNASRYGLRPEEHLILTFIQVGRAITFVNPVYDATASDPLATANFITSVAATDLTNVFGP
jgi:hypothetical protein